MKLALVNGGPDWWLIERAVYDGDEWWEPVMSGGVHGRKFLRSARLRPDADIEGTAAEMLHIASAIEQRGGYSAKRCEVVVRGDQVYLCSPRNSTGNAVVTLEEADAFAAEIRGKIEEES